MSGLTFAKDEKPPFAFCEPVHAGPLRRWCIRKVGPEGLKLGGGVPTGPLCRRWDRGWDLNVRITEAHITDACPSCVAEYRRLTSPATTT